MSDSTGGTGQGTGVPLIGRLARYLASTSGPRQEARSWGECVEQAASILALMKDPDTALAEAGDDITWRAMIDAALIARWDVDRALKSDSKAPPGGTDEEGDMRLRHSAVDGTDRPSWI
jgi:hypothetical protein